MRYDTPTSASDIVHRFDFHPATSAEKRNDRTSVRQACRQLAHQLDQELPPGREKSLAITQLEQCMFWANAAIARNTEREVGTVSYGHDGIAVPYGTGHTNELAPLI